MADAVRAFLDGKRGDGEFCVPVAASPADS
jgi:hypothetical protein